MRLSISKLPWMIMGLCLLSFLGCRNQTLPDGSQKHGAESAGKKGGSANGSESNPKNDPSLSRVTQKKGKGSAVVPPAKKDFEFVWRKDTGIQFVHQSGFDEKRAFPAANGSGLGIIDFDRDGLEDIQFASGKFFPLDPADHRSPCQLYRNLGNWKFENCSKEAGAEENGYAVGITVGDFDNDGFQDFYVGCYGENALYINRGDGSFEKMNGEGLPKGRPSRPEGLDPSVPDTPGWATSSAFLDFDGDGNLDLYVGNYGIWDLNLKRIAEIWLVMSPDSAAQPPFDLREMFFIKTTVTEPLLMSLKERASIPMAKGKTKNVSGKTFEPRESSLPI